MRCWLLFISFFLFTSVHAQKLTSLRKEYYAAINSASATNKLHEKLKELSPSDPVMMAYMGSTQALKARFSWNPYNKLSYLSQGLKTLGTAVNKNPENLEIRFLRFTLVHYLPAFLGYSKTLEPDKEKIVELISKREFGSLDNNLLKNLIGFMKETKQCTPAELAILDKAVTNG
jgi:hypothetical protein